MSIELVDGPCKGAYLVRRAPAFLRAVKTEHLFSEIEADVLDQLADTPAADEKVFVYQRDGQAGAMHLLARGKGGKNITGWYQTGRYHHLPDVDGEQVRDNARWLEWSERQIASREGRPA
jgi:hypothetical protein